MYCITQLLRVPYWTFSQLPIPKFQNFNCKTAFYPKYYPFRCLFSEHTIINRKDLNTHTQKKIN